jgi:hypothetical protein
MVLGAQGPAPPLWPIDDRLVATQIHIQKIRAKDSMEKVLGQQGESALPELFRWIIRRIVVFCGEFAE